MLDEGIQLIAIKNEFKVENLYAINENNTYMVHKRNDGSLFVYDDIGKYYDIPENIEEIDVFEIVQSEQK